MQRFRGVATVLMMISVFAVSYGCALLNRAPIASFNASPEVGSVPLIVEVNASGSLDPDGDAMTYAWDFGDGTFGAGLTATHTYVVSGQYTIRLIATDSQGQQSSTAQTIWVIEQSDLPEAVFTASPLSGGNAAASTDPNGAITAYHWSYGDGSTGSGVSVLHTYSAEGTYMATLTVTDDEGFSDTLSMLIVVITGGQGGCS